MDLYMQTNGFLACVSVILAFIFSQSLVYSLIVSQNNNSVDSLLQATLFTENDDKSIDYSPFLKAHNDKCGGIFT